MIIAVCSIGVGRIDALALDLIAIIVIIDGGSIT